MKAFEKELKEQLAKDGYATKDQKIVSMTWTDDGNLEVNGKKIKDSDKEKYKAIKKKYFDESSHFHYVE
jgi:hypothetical protein